MPTQDHPLRAALEALEPLPTGAPLVRFARGHHLHVWFGVGPFDTGGWGSNPWGSWIVLPKAFREPAVMARLENVLLIGHELVHVMQNAARGGRLPFPLYREVEAHIVQQTLTWEAAPLAANPAATAQAAARNLVELTRDLASGFAYVVACGEGLKPLNYYRTPLFTSAGEGDPLATLAELLEFPAFPDHVRAIVAGG